MTCLNPYFAVRSLTPNKNGKYELAEFVPYRKLSAKTLEYVKAHLAENTGVIVPCGQCMGCRLDKANDWAIRCVHEAKLHLQNCFITLTYKPECLPPDSSLHRDHLQLFLNGCVVIYLIMIILKSAFYVAVSMALSIFVHIIIFCALVGFLAMYGDSKR